MKPSATGDDATKTHCAEATRVLLYFVRHHPAKVELCYLSFRPAASLRNQYSTPACLVAERLGVVEAFAVLADRGGSGRIVQEGRS